MLSKAFKNEHTKWSSITKDTAATGQQNSLLRHQAMLFLWSTMRMPLEQARDHLCLFCFQFWLQGSGLIATIPLPRLLLVQEVFFILACPSRVNAKKKKKRGKNFAPDCILQSCRTSWNEQKCSTTRKNCWNRFVEYDAFHVIKGWGRSRKRIETKLDVIINLRQ